MEHIKSKILNDACGLNLEELFLVTIETRLVVENVYSICSHSNTYTLFETHMDIELFTCFQKL